MANARSIPSLLRSTAKSGLLRAFGAVERLPRGAGNGVLLTFDDGPHPSITDHVLERLAAYGARAVFFVVGNRIDLAPHVLNRIVGEGHLLGNHTFQHALDRQPRFLPYVRDLRRCQALVADLVGEPPHLFRPALGQITAGSLVGPRMIGLSTIYWSVDSADWQLRDAVAAAAVARRLADEIRSRDIVLLHDDNPCVLDVLDLLLPALCSKGYDLASAVQLLRRHGHGSRGVTSRAA